MTSAALAISPASRSGGLTMRLGKMLGIFGVDPLQYSSLLDAMLKMDFRPRASTISSRTRSALRTMVIVNVIYGTIFALLMAAGANAYFYSVMLIGYSMAMVGMFILVEFGMIVIAPEDFLILAHRPISSRTFLAVRISNLLFYILILACSLALAPSLIGLMLHGVRWWFPVVYFAASVAAILFMTGAMVGTYGLLIRWLAVERFKDVLAYFQIAFSFVIFLGYQIIPRVANRVRHLDIQHLAHGWMMLLPPIWFAGLIDLAQGEANVQALATSGIAIVALLVIVPLVLRSVSMDYAARLADMTTASTKSNVSAPIARKRGKGITHLLARDPEQLAFLQFVLTMIRRNRRLKLQLYPNFGSMVALFAVALLEPAGRLDPFLDPGASPIVLFFAGLAAVLGAMALGGTVPFSDEFAGGWIFQLAPLRRPAQILSALRKALVITILVPFVIVTVAIFSWFWTPMHAVELGIYAAWGGVIAFEIALLTFDGFPFSKRIEKGAQGRQLAMTLVSLPILGVIIGIPAALGMTQKIIGCTFACGVGMWLILRFVNNRRYTRKGVFEVE